MKKVSLKNVKTSLSRTEMRSITAGAEPTIDTGDGLKICTCVMENGRTSHQVANCDQCFAFCPTLGDGLKSTWCIG